jgi:sugar O-acyltransferase (sialic acid O-acetyltransferase NeuD family)
MPPGELIVYAVGSAYAWDVVETVQRTGRRAICVDNTGEADTRLPGLTATTEPGSFVLGLSSARYRPVAAEAAKQAGFVEPVVLVDPTAAVASTADLGHGCYVNAGTVVASNTTVGCHANLNRSVSIGHDNSIGFAVSFGPGAVLAGHVQVGAGAFIGAGATILPEVRIGPGASVGAGAVVIRDVGPGEVVVGNPARVIRSADSGEISCPHC